MSAELGGTGGDGAYWRRLEPASCRDMMPASAITICLTPLARRTLVLRVPQLSAQSLSRRQGGLLLEPLRCLASHGGAEHIDCPNSGRRFRRAGRFSRTIGPRGLCSVVSV